MNYTKLALIGLGLFGVFIHCLVELNKVNKKNKGINIQLTLKNYFALEVFSMLLSTCIVIVCAMISSEVYKALEKIGYEWAIGAAFGMIGYSAQSLLFFAVGKTNKVIGNEDTTNNNNITTP